MDDSARFSLSGPATEDGSSSVVVGKAFAFMQSGLLLPAGLSWLTRALGVEKPRGPKIVSLFGEEKIELFGLTIEPTRHAELKLASVTSDKSLYRAEQDAINIFIVNLLAANRQSALVVNCNGSEYAKHRFKFGSQGEAHIVLSNLPVGEFEVFLQDNPEEKCEFVVAEYRLAPLVASMVQSLQLPDNELEVVLKLTSFGVPVQGSVNVDVMDRNFRIKSINTQPENGLVKITFKADGLGPHSLHVQLSDEPGKTASVPIRGSREKERSRTVFSPLGTEIVGSLIAESGTRPVRGIHLGGSDVRTTSISLEKVDALTARLRLNTAVDSICIVAIDATYPRKRVGAVDINKQVHPENADPEYNKAVALFRQGKYKEAAETFEAASPQINPHPYYAYWIACCHARQGNLDEAVAWLRQSIEDGWCDREHMVKDEDLASLRHYEPFVRLSVGGIRETSFTNLPAGHVIAVEGFAPVTILAIGAFIDNKPWEGWASLLPPGDLTTKIDIPERCRPAGELAINVAVRGSQPAVVFAVLKDARLLSTDTPEIRLAAGLKSYVEFASDSYPVGFASSTVRDIKERIRPMPGQWGSGETFGSVGSWGGGSFGSGVSPFLAGPGSDPPVPTSPMAWGSPPPSSAFEGSIQARSRGSLDAQNPVAAQPQSIGAKFGAAIATAEAVAGSLELSAASKQAPSLLTQRQSLEQMKEAEAPLPLVEPEVVFAGFLKVIDGVAQLRATLPDAFADYIFECFTISGTDWCLDEKRFCVVKDPFVHLTLPVFARSDEYAMGTIHVGSSADKVQVKLLRDGVEVQLFRDERPLDASEFVSGQTIALNFSATPGEYQAILLAQDGTILSRVARYVQEPGKLKRRLRTLRLLESGQSVALSDDQSFVSLALMPSIEKSFQVLIEATANYGHSCCEQTSAILLSACAMYVFSGDDGARRARAESIILAGVQRERSMWLPGRGFKMYPEMPDEPNVYLSERAAANLWNLSLVKDGVGSDLSLALSESIESGLQMAADVTRSLKMTWPPREIDSCESAYAVLRFGTSGSADSALDFLLRYDPEKPSIPSRALQYLGSIVSKRLETAYAAAGILRAGGAQHLKRALDLANKVIGQFNEEGRLYSTCDSVAAIALMSELQRAKITGGGGSVELDGQLYSMQEALNHFEPVKSVKVKEGCATVSIDRVVEEDWSKFQSNIQVKIGLLQNDKASNSFRAGEALTLTVKLEEGYKDGDLLWVCLPEAISRVVGGGQVKLFAVDFRGRSEIQLPLAATGTTRSRDGKASQQQLGICVRNMFQEERVASPGLIAVEVN